MFVCTGRFGVLHVTKNAETRHTRIHTYTHTFVIFFQGLKPCFMHACIWGNRRGHRANNALLGIFGGLKTCFLQASIWENRRRHKANNALLGIFGGLKACFLQAWNREIDANTKQIVHFSADATS